MARPRPRVVGDCARGDPIHPPTESFTVFEIRKTAVHANERFLHDVVHVGRRHAARDVRSKPRLDFSPRAASLRGNHEAEPPGAQHEGPQQLFAPPGFRASIVADAT